MSLQRTKKRIKSQKYRDAKRNGFHLARYYRMKGGV